MEPYYTVRETIGESVNILTSVRKGDSPLNLKSEWGVQRFPALQHQIPKVWVEREEIRKK